MHPDNKEASFTGGFFVVRMVQCYFQAAVGSLVEFLKLAQKP